MKRLLALCALVLAGAAHAQTPPAADIEKALTNLAIIHDIAFSIEFQRNSTGSARVANLSDPWGTPYRIDATNGTYRIASAGADKSFDEPSWANQTQFEGVAGDVIFADGRVVRSNRNWLMRRVGNDNAALQKLRDRERQYMVMRAPEMLDAVAARTTLEAVRSIGELVQKYRDAHGGLSGLVSAPDMLGALGVSVAEDAWRTPIRLIVDGETYRVISAGSDRSFDPNSWSTPITLDTAEDVVFENGKFTRYLDLAEYMRVKVPPKITPLAQPPDARREPKNGWYLVGGGVTAPVATKRVEPHYPNDARQMHVSGIVILQVAVDAKGAIEEVRILKSLWPDIDAAALEAVRQWQFNPGTLDRNPVPVLLSLPINFKLE